MRAVLPTFVLTLAFAGCMGPNVYTIRRAGQLASVPGGPCAVLSVTAKDAAVSKGGRSTFGTLTMGEAERSFAERLAYCAAEYGGMAVIPASDAEKRLRGKFKDYTLQPSEDQINAYAGELGLASYLTAQVREARLRYVLMFSWASVDYSVDCFDARTHRLLWHADVVRRKHYRSERELVTASLRDLFLQFQRGLPSR